MHCSMSFLPQVSLVCTTTVHGAWVATTKTCSGCGPRGRSRDSNLRPLSSARCAHPCATLSSEIWSTNTSIPLCSKAVMRCFGRQLATRAAPHPGSHLVVPRRSALLLHTSTALGPSPSDDQFHAGQTQLTMPDDTRSRKTNVKVTVTETMPHRWQPKISSYQLSQGSWGTHGKVMMPSITLWFRLGPKTACCNIFPSFTWWCLDGSGLHPWWRRPCCSVFAGAR